MKYGAKQHRTVSALLVALTLAGCVTTTPYVGQGPYPQLQRGAPCPPIDFAGSILSLPNKLILWNWRFNNHEISPETEAKLIRYLDAKKLPAFEDTRYRLNQYAPIDDLRALIRNRYVGWPYRLLIGLPATLLTDILLPGRLFPWGDYFNPYTNVCHLYSDDPTISLHEAGHAYDFADFPHKGTYALIRTVPFVDLYQEWRATDNAINHLIEVQDRPLEYHAYRTLWPAYGTYLGSYAPIPFGSMAGALVGHVAGYFKMISRRRWYQRMDLVLQQPELALQARQKPLPASTAPAPQPTLQRATP